MRRRSRRAERGLALISVLWVTALLALLAAGFTADTRTESRLARNLRENAEAEALADAGVHHGALRLLARPVDQPWREASASYRFRLARGTVAVDLQDEEALVDLNRAPDDLLAGLIEAVGAGPEDAAALAARIVDFRDADQEPGPDGAEDPDYAALGLEHEAKDAPFESASELLLIPGFAPELYERLRAHVTIFTGSEGIDPSRAARPVLSAVPGMTPEIVDALMALGPEEDLYEVIDETTLIGLEPYFVFSSEILFRVRATGTSAGGGVFVRQAVIELLGDSAEPFLIHDWRRGRVDEAALVDEADGRPDDLE